MAAIKAVIYVFENDYHLGTEHRSPIYYVFSQYIFRDSICLHFKFGKGQTEVIFKVKLSLKI